MLQSFTTHRSAKKSPIKYYVNPMKLIIGLGNPGAQYEYTRHNTGFLALDFLRSQWKFTTFMLNKKFHAEISEGIYNEEKTLLMKPQSFMNNSGTCVRALIDFYKMTPRDITVFHDELDLPFGTYKISDDSRAAGHNGVQDIIDHLGTQTFRRIRIGVDKRDAQMRKNINGRDYVLQKFSKEELKSLQTVLKEITITKKLPRISMTRQ